MSTLRRVCYFGRRVCIGFLFLDSPGEDLCGDPDSNKSNWKENSKHKAIYYREGAVTRWESGQVLQGGTGPRLFRNWIFVVVSLGWEELWYTVGWSLMEAASSHLGNSSHRLGGGFLTPQGLYQNVMTAFLYQRGYNHNANSLCWG